MCRKQEGNVPRTAEIRLLFTVVKEATAMVMMIRL